MIFSYRSALAIVARLRNPFSWNKDRINVEELIASTEVNLFTVLRISFRQEDETEEDADGFDVDQPVSDIRRINHDGKVETVHPDLGLAGRRRHAVSDKVQKGRKSVRMSRNSIVEIETAYPHLQQARARRKAFGDKVAAARKSGYSQRIDMELLDVREI